MKEIIEIHLAKLTNGAHFEFMTTAIRAHGECRCHTRCGGCARRIHRLRERGDQKI